MKRMTIALIALVLGSQMVGASSEGLVMENRPTPSIDWHNYQIPHQRKANFPASYDSREHGYNYPVRDQVIGGPCWAFAHTDAMRAGMNTLGCPVSDAFATSILTNCHTCNVPHLTGGGNQAMAVTMITLLQGPVLEKDYPYSTTDTLCPEWKTEDLFAYPLSAAFLPKGDATSIKGAILEFGIISGAMYWNHDFYDDATNTYCYTGDQPANHEICLIGWDDTKRAWLVRNSWGPNALVDGHVWVSYDDVYIDKECTTYYQMVPKSEIDQVYTYSTSASINYENGYPEEPIAGIVHFNTPTQQTITYIGTYVKQPNSYVSYRIYQGHELLYQSSKERVTYPSFTTFAVEKPIQVTGDFYVRVEYSQENGTGLLPIETLEQPVYHPILHTGDQWVDRSGEYDQAGAGSMFEADLAIYVYTKDANPTIVWDLPEETGTPILVDGKITPEVWKKASVINIFNTAGQLVQVLKSSDDALGAHLVSGRIYLFQVIHHDNSTYTQKISFP